jgi:16S rRNA U1498 N3-methylase RsmE
MLILHFKCLSVANTKMSLIPIIKISTLTFILQKSAEVGTKNFVYHTSRNYFASIRTRLRLVQQTVLMLANVQFPALCYK